MSGCEECTDAVRAALSSLIRSTGTTAFLTCLGRGFEVATPHNHPAPSVLDPMSPLGAEAHFPCDETLPTPDGWVDYSVTIANLTPAVVAAGGPEPPTAQPRLRPLGT